jgi:hypothetical protein
MDTSIIIQYLQIFGLTVFGLFFLALLVIAIYLIFLVKIIKKGVQVLLSDAISLVGFVEAETESLSSMIKSKIAAINIEKILFGSTILGGIIAGIKNATTGKKTSSKKK